MLLEKIEKIKKESLSVKLNIFFKFKRITMYFVRGELINLSIVPNFGDTITGKEAMKRILKMGNNFQRVEMTELSNREIFKVSIISITNKNPGIEDMRNFFFYITPEQIRILTYLVFEKPHAYVDEINGKEYEYEIFDLWENGIIEFYGFTLAISQATRHILLKLLKEKLRETIKRYGRADEEFLKEQGFAVFKKDAIIIPEEYRQILKESVREEIDKKKLLLQKYKIKEPSKEEIMKLLSPE